jgi:hypothetical protein
MMPGLWSVSKINEESKRIKLKRAKSKEKQFYLISNVSNQTYQPKTQY